MLFIRFEIPQQEFKAILCLYILSTFVKTGRRFQQEQVTFIFYICIFTYPPGYEFPFAIFNKPVSRIGYIYLSFFYSVNNYKMPLSPMCYTGQGYFFFQGFEINTYRQ